MKIDSKANLEAFPNKFLVSEAQTRFKVAKKRSPAFRNETQGKLFYGPQGFFFPSEVTGQTCSLPGSIFLFFSFLFSFFFGLPLSEVPFLKAPGIERQSSPKLIIPPRFQWRQREKMPVPLI